MYILGPIMYISVLIWTFIC